jgi:hypothetical protein
MTIGLFENGELCNILIRICGLSGFVVRLEQDIVFVIFILLLLFLARDPEVPGSIPGTTRFSEK